MSENSVADDILRSGYERWSRLEGEKQAISDDLKELFAELKRQGFDGKALRASFRLVAKADDAEVQEHNAVVDLYVSSLMGNRAPSVGTVPATRTHAAREAAGATGADLTRSAVARASAIAAEQAADGIDWVRALKVEPTRHPYSKAFDKLGQDHHVIQDDIEGAKSAPIVVLGDEILDGWARYNSARCTKGIDGESAFFPVVEYEGQDPLTDCIKWNVSGRMMNEADRLIVAQRLTKIEPKRKRDIYAAFELGMELVS